MLLRGTYLSQKSLGKMGLIRNLNKRGCMGKFLQVRKNNSEQFNSMTYQQNNGVNLC